MRSLPNIITLLNLYAGCLGIYFVYEERPLMALFAIGLSLLFDFFDGLAARLLDKSGPLGVQLDSLADVVSFGVLPSTMLFSLLQSLPELQDAYFSYIPFLAFILAVFGAYRLAKFNIDQRDADHFFGLPIPSAAIYFAGLYWLAHASDCLTCASAFINPYVLVVSLIFICYLMISDMPHFNLKMKGLSWKGQEIKWLFIALVVVLAFFLKQAAVPFAVVLYIFLSLIYSSKKVDQPLN